MQAEARDASAGPGDGVDVDAEDRSLAEAKLPVAQAEHREEAAELPAVADQSDPAALAGMLRQRAQQRGRRHAR